MNADCKASLNRWEVDCEDFPPLYLVFTVNDEDGDANNSFSSTELYFGKSTAGTWMHHMHLGCQVPSEDLFIDFPLKSFYAAQRT